MRHQSGDCQRHRHAVIVVALHNCALEVLRADDAESVGMFLDLCAHFAQFRRHDRDPVGFFDAQFRRVTDECFAFGLCCSNHQDREFVNRAHDYFSANRRAVQGGALDDQISDRLAALFTRIDLVNFCAHRRQNIEDANARGVGSDARDLNFVRANQQRRDDHECR